MTTAVAYVVSRFPKTTETFIAREMAAVADAGTPVELVALRRETAEILQPDAARFIDRLRAVSDLGPGELIAAQLRSFLASPRRWARMWVRAIVGNRGSLKFLARGIVAAAGAPALAVRLEQRRVTHLHAHWGTHAALLAYLIHLLTDIPFSVTLHAHDLHTDRTMLAEKLRAASAVATISEHNRALIEELYADVADRVEVVHCGVDSTAIRRRPSTRPPTRRIAMVAGLRPFKGHTHVLGALAALVDDDRILHLDLVGAGPSQAELEAEAKELGVEKLVHFHGAVDVERALEIVADADVAVMSSVVMPDGRRDGIPVALIEAMAIGTPVVATAVSGIPELVRDGDTGLLVEPADPAALAAAIAETLDDPEAAAIRVQAARELVESDYDIAGSGATMIEMWERPTAAPANEGVQMGRPMRTRVAVVITAALLGALIALVWGRGQDDVYRAEAVLAFAPAADLDLDADVIDVIGALDRGVLPETAAGLATSGSVKDESASRIGLTEGLGAYRISAAPVFEANLLDVVARGPDPEVAAALANAVADVLAERVEGLYQVYVVDVVTRATPPDAESRSVGLLVAAAALLFAVGAAAVIVGLDRTAPEPEPAGSS